MKAKHEPLDAEGYQTVAIGTGPIGLAAALSALRHCKQNEKVAIVADRLEELGIREQILYIDQDVLDFLTKLVGTDLIELYKAELTITPGKQSGFFITTGDLEKLLFTALKNNYQEGVHFDLFQAKKIGPGQKSADAIQIDQQNTTITMQTIGTNGKSTAPTETTLKFKYLIGADGAKRSIAKSLGEDEPIFDVTTQHPLPHTKHVVAIFRIPEGTSPQACVHMKVAPESTGPERKVVEATGSLPERVIDPCPLSELRDKYGWQAYNRPHSQVLATRDVIYIGAEIPAHLSKEEAKEYGKLLMRDHLPQEYIDRIQDTAYDVTTSFGKKQDQLRVSMFDILLGDLNQTLRVCGDTAHEETTGAMFFMGDSRKNPLYTTGTGAQTGIREASSFDEFLSSMSMPDAELGKCLAAYHAHARAILDKVGETQEKWILMREGRVKDAVKNFEDFNKHKGDIASISLLIKKVNQWRDETAEKADEHSDFLDEVHKNLNELLDKYKKVFECCKDPDDITSYNGVNVREMLQHFKEMREALFLKYPKENMDMTSQAVADIYQQLKSQLAVEPRSQYAFFSSKQPTQPAAGPAPTQGTKSP
ncbi:hypothetical protein [Legionella shakespearei]|uniref:Kynurenine 3-monooxygenase n=1 Tax=Legionella shakespearei DSM 23087 TaxID=1122169 RepID=A0A0W0Z0G2_9GAMM|nr:hypothetical protein [Legionella shakespearei]KTD62367.1 hypothetical protein Lsha_1067 [Legionella shakespearei DSM 23087]